MNKSTIGKEYDEARYLEWIIHERECQGTYHNHKETMAWAATAFYIPGIIALGYNASLIGKLCQYLPLYTPFIVLCILVLIFVGIQFCNRWKAAETVAGLIRVAAQLLNGELSLNDSNVKIEDNKHKRWPKFVEDAIENTKKAEANRLKKDKWATMGASYIAIILATTFALGLVCAH